MTITRFSMMVAAIAVVTVVAPARADSKSDRDAIAGSLTRLAASATKLANQAKASDDRGARKKFGPAATELSDDLGALARRLQKDVPLKTLAGDASEAEKQANALVELADEAEDKAERKELRAQASLIAQGVASARKSIDAAANAKPEAAQAPARYTGRLFNNSNKCSWAENLKFVITRDGRQVFATQMVFPGKDFAVVLEHGAYHVTVHDTSGELKAQGRLDANKEGWTYSSGCVNQD